MRTRLIGGIVGFMLMIALTPVARAIGPIVRIEISPATVSVMAGSRTAFTVIGQDTDGITTDLTVNSTFTTTDPTGTISANVYSASKAGIWSTTARFDTLTSSAAVTVTPGEVSDVVVNPNSDPERIMNGQSRTFTVEAFDEFNNSIKNVTTDWSLEGKIGTIKTTGKTTAKFTSSNDGSGRVIAKIGNLKGFVTVVVAKSVIATNTNTTAVTSVNANRNTNATTNTHVPAVTNLNAVNANTNSSNTQNGPACRAWPRSGWMWLVAVYLVLLAGSLWAVRRSQPVWWWVAPFILTVGSLWAYFQFRCYPIFPGLPYLILLAAIIGASWYTWQRGTNVTIKH